MIEALGYGVYTHSEAAKLTGLKISRVREWFRFQLDRPEPMLRSHYEKADGERVISFLDLVDVFVAGQLREHGVSLQNLRKVYKKLSIDLDSLHPFSRQELLSDGKTVFSRGLTAKGQEQIREVLTGQGVFPHIIRPFLKQIDYDYATSLALRWHFNKDVVLDPTIYFGQPIVEEIGIPTYILSNAYRANNADANKVAAWYKIQPSQVLAAVHFESSLAV